MYINALRVRINTFVITKAPLSNHHQKQPAIVLNSRQGNVYSNDVDVLYHINYYSSNYSTLNHAVP